jgi:hypothetical protein
MIVPSFSGVGSPQQLFPSERKGSRPFVLLILCWLLTTPYVGYNRYTLINSNRFDPR